MTGMTRLACLGALLLLASCDAPKATTPSLSPEEAASLLRYNNKAQNWMTFVKKNNAGCEYRLDLPDQSSHPAAIDLNHIVVCGNRPSPKQFDAGVSFEYDKANAKWVITRFSS